MKGHIGAAVLCLFAVTQGRVLDPELLDNYWADQQSDLDYIQKLKALTWDAVPYYGEDMSRSSLREVPHWPTSTTKPVIGQVGGLATDSAGNVVVFHRAERRWGPTSFIFNRLNSALGPIQSDVILTLSGDTGEIVSQLGAGEFYMPHGLTIDKDENMWLTDVGRHQVLKIPKGSTTPIEVLGEKMVPGNDETHLCKPTDVAVASNGDFFVADGYCNSRIMKFSADEKFIKQWGRPTQGFTEPEQDQFHIPHSLALDESRDRLYVADRENARIQIFHAGLNGTEAGTFVSSFRPGRGTIYAVEYDPNADVLYAVNGPGMGGIIEGFTLDYQGNILETWGPDNRPFDQPHDVTVSRDGMDVFVGDIGSHTGVYKMDRPIGNGQVIGK